ncbi:tRNA dihydrouridine synthase DusB [uncultured Tyzzerella sp.]|uniref:tRNA dihydrouridine synthase DusB n=1 Tax=uncultured Tyzzerella sp. TaxID=2321398 RepID=UPI002942BFE3|nr:tRNA dihydrouridine synthase DusB [uncultured Tyzzerella sp.]
MKIGNFEPQNNVFLAPMAGVTDVVFRTLCKEQGCGLTYSEMVSAKGIMYDNDNTKKLLEIDKSEGKVAVQLFGSDPDVLSDMAKKLDSNEDIGFFDINMGCPAPKIVKNGDGSALMKNPKLIGKIVKAVSSSTSKPLTIKIRKGYDDDCVNAVEIAKIVEENGGAGLAIHGRTREQFYSGNADWDIIKKVKENVSIPIIGNGDITSPEKAKEILEYTGCDAIMIGREAQGNPWIFKRVVHYLKTGEIISNPSINEKIDVAIKHLHMLIQCKGEYIAIREMRKHLGWYIKGMPKSSEMRVIINGVEKPEKMEELLLSMKQ